MKKIQTNKKENLLVDPAKLRRYKQENKDKENKLHNSAKLKAHRIAKKFGCKIIDEAIMNPYILDMYIPEIKTAIEIDGSSHDTKYSYDDRRDEYLSSQYGIKVLRFNSDDLNTRETRIFEETLFCCFYEWVGKHIEELNYYALKRKCSHLIPDCYKKFTDKRFEKTIKKQQNKIIESEKKGFMEWWESHPIQKSGMQPIMIKAFQELAEGAWDSCVISMFAKGN